MKRLKIISLLMLITLIFSANYVFADNETQESGKGTITSEDNATTDNTENSQNTTENVTADNTSNNTAKKEDDSYKTQDVFLTGDNVTVDYIVDGNLFVKANDTVTINSQIGGDVFVIAKHVKIGEDGYIFNNMFVIAQDVQVNGIVFDAFGAVKDFTISDGAIYRDLKLICDKLTINGGIGRDAFVNAGNIEFNTDGKENGVIKGNLKYYSSNEMDINNSLVRGNINFKSTAISKGTIVKIYLFVACSFVLLVIAIWLIGKLLAPKFIEKSKEYEEKNWKHCLKLLGIGIVAVVIIPVICAILSVFKITACVSVIIATLFVLMCAISLPTFVILLNDYLCGKMKITKELNKFLMLIAFSVITFVIYSIPYAGAILAILTSLATIGNINYIIFKKENKNKNVGE